MSARFPREANSFRTGHCDPVLLYPLGRLFALLHSVFVRMKELHPFVRGTPAFLGGSHQIRGASDAETDPGSREMPSSTSLARHRHHRHAVVAVDVTQLMQRASEADAAAEALSSLNGQSVRLIAIAQPHERETRVWIRKTFPGVFEGLVFAKRDGGGNAAVHNKEEATEYAPRFQEMDVDIAVTSDRTRFAFGRDCVVVRVGKTPSVAPSEAKELNSAFQSAANWSEVRTILDELCERWRRERTPRRQRLKPTTTRSDVTVSSRRSPGMHDWAHYARVHAVVSKETHRLSSLFAW